MSDLDAERTQKLARKSAWITGILTLILPFGGYLYTGRYLFAGGSFVIWAVLMAMTNPDVENDPAAAGGAILMIVTAIENLIAVSRAKGACKDQQSQEPIPKRSDDLQVELLRLAQSKGEVTIADCVLATAASVEEIRRLLLEFEHQDMMRSGNREGDGAVVYRIV
jgi:hypothetical protein